MPFLFIRNGLQSDAQDAWTDICLWRRGVFGVIPYAHQEVLRLLRGDPYESEVLLHLENHPNNDLGKLAKLL